MYLNRDFPAINLKPFESLLFFVSYRKKDTKFLGIWIERVL